MRLSEHLREGIFVERLTRFSALVEVAGRRELVHVANSGRMKELLAAGKRVYVTCVDSPRRKTGFDLTLVRLPSALVSADSRLPPALLEEGIEQANLEEFGDHHLVRREVKYGTSRLDMQLMGDVRPCLVEVKSVTLVVDGFGRFPDAPTDRGRRHVRSLIEAHRAGYRAAVVFVIQRPDVEGLLPYRQADPDFWTTLEEARDGGVEVFAYRCRVSLEEIAITDPVPVML